MSAAIHPFPGRDPHHAPRLGDDDLLAELAAAVGNPPTPARRSATVTRLPVRRGGDNDLVMSGSRAGSATNSRSLAGSPIVRRRATAVVVATVLLALAFALLAGLGGASADGDPAVVTTVTLEGGDTLWGIAEDATPAGGDVRATVAAIMDLNDFESPTLPIGTLVQVPDLAG